MISSGGMMDELAEDFRRRIRMLASWLVLVAILLVHLWTLVEVGSGNGEAWYEWLGLSRSGMGESRYWQIFSHGLLHGSWRHLLVNAILVWLLGTRLELMMGWRVMLVVTASGIVTGGMMHLLLGHGLLVGISGGAMALLLCLASLSPDARVLPLGISARNLGRGVLIGELLLALVDPALGMPVFSPIGELLVDQGFASLFQLGHACHFGGGLAGICWARKFRGPRLTLKKLRLDRERRERAEGG
jgi:membrane associated rhomboid family serine protease